MNFILILHILAAILLLGPVTVAVSAFAPAIFAASQGNELARGRAYTMYKITRAYGLLSLIVPILGVAVMLTDSSYWKEGRFHASILLSVIAWAVLFFLVLPRQKRTIEALNIIEEGEEAPKELPTIPDWNKAKAQLSMFGGIFSLLWVIIAILMLI